MECPGGNQSCADHSTSSCGLSATAVGAMMLMGGIWILQGLNLAFRVGFMVGNYHWTIYGAILALVGVGEVIWSNARQHN